MNPRSPYVGLEMNPRSPRAPWRPDNRFYVAYALTAKVQGTTPWWTTDPEGPAFEAARGALKAGFGKETATVGSGGTIGFVQPFADLLEGAPCILMGVADPNTRPTPRTRASTWATG